MQYEKLLAILDLDLALHAVEPLLALVADELVARLARRIDGDDEGIDVTRWFAGSQAEVGQVARIVIRLETLEARDLLHLLGRDVQGPQSLVVVHERAEAHAKSTRDLDKGR